MGIARITDHAERAKARLPSHLQGAPNLEALMGALAGRVQGLEDEAFRLYEERAISTAQGAQLDAVGTLLNLPRRVGQSDAQYRVALFGRAGSLKKSGEPEAVIDAFKKMVAASRVYTTEYRPATVELQGVVAGDTPDPALDAFVVATLWAVRAAGVNLLPGKVQAPAFLWGDAADTDADGELPADSNQGAGDAANADPNGEITPGPGQGGNLARMLI